MLKISVKHLFNAKKIKRNFKLIKKLKKQNYQVIFEQEGNTAISLPKITLWSYITSGAKLLDFASRPNKESLLRKVVFELFEQEYLDKNQSMIDIGCWISDNALVWASLIDDSAVIHAVDPSINNIKFGKKLSALNNIKYYEAVCSDKTGKELKFNGNIDHASFEKSTKESKKTILSTTLDEIVMGSRHKEISLIHVDVEGFEEKVIKGAETIISTNLPVIIFEQHISEENTKEILSYLKNKGYRVFMINEVLPGCQLDCRNFIAFHSSRALPELSKPQHWSGRKQNIWYASIENYLIPIDQ